MNKYIPHVSIILCSVLYFFVTKDFPLGVTPDSIDYFKIATSFSNGNWGTINDKLVTHWPLGYPILLSFFSQITGLSVLAAGKILNLILFVINGFVFKSILDQFNLSKSIKISLLLSFLVGLPMTVALFAWSELPFIVLINSAFLFLIKSRNSSEISSLIIAGTFGFFALMTRHAAVGFIGGFMLFLLFSENQSLQNKIKKIVLFATPILLGIVLWITFTSFFETTGSEREFTKHIVPIHKLLFSFKQIFYWFGNGLLAKFPTVILLITLIIILIRNKGLKLNPNQTLLIPIIAISACYFGSIVFSISFFDAYTPLDNRILSPLFPFVLLILGIITNEIIKHQNKILKQGLPLLLVLCSFLSASETWKNHIHSGSIYTGILFNNYKSRVLNHVINFKGTTYSNGAEFLQFISHLTTIKSLPEKISPYTLKNRANYSNALEQIKMELETNQAQIIYFDIIDRCWFQVCKDSLIKTLPNEQYKELNEITIIR